VINIQRYIYGVNSFKRSTKRGVKAFYLKSVLAGDAAIVIQCFENSAKNYKIVWDCFNERYNKRIIVQEAHTKAISN